MMVFFVFSFPDPVPPFQRRAAEGTLPAMASYSSFIIECYDNKFRVNFLLKYIETRDRA